MMAIDINYNSIATDNIIYQWWCPKCQVSHATPCCPYVSDDELMKLSSHGIPGICLVCGQPIWEHGMTLV